jgi:hypothetical protein
MYKARGNNRGRDGNRPHLFHVFLRGETILLMPELSDFDRGLLVGLMIGEASFGGDGKQPQVTVRMHVRHEALFGWLMERFPETRLYGPYHHGGRSYYQWMARGTALVRDVLPVLEGELHGGLDGYAADRYEAMCSRYAAYIARERARLGLSSG